MWEFRPGSAMRPGGLTVTITTPGWKSGTETDGHYLGPVSRSRCWIKAGLLPPLPGQCWFILGPFLPCSGRRNGGTDANIYYSKQYFCVRACLPSAGSGHAGRKALSGARVRFELLNYAELYPLHTAVTGEDGTVELLAGKGSLYLHVSQNGKYCNRLVDLRKESAVTVSMDEAVFARNGVEEFEMVPPEERIPETAAVSPELEALHEKRLLHCEALRREREADWYTEETARAELQGRGGEEFVRVLVCSRGNFPEIAAFLLTAVFPTRKKPNCFPPSEKRILWTVRQLCWRNIWNVPRNTGRKFPPLCMQKGFCLQESTTK